MLNQNNKPKYTEGFKIYLEELETTLNSDKEIKLKDYNDKLQYYNSKKSLLKNILSKPFEKQELEASKIILSNPYLGTEQKVLKIENQINTDTEKLKGNLTQEEAKKIQETINNNKNELNNLKNNLNKKIKEDLDLLKKL